MVGPQRPHRGTAFRSVRHAPSASPHRADSRASSWGLLHEGVRLLRRDVDEHRLLVTALRAQAVELPVHVPHELEEIRVPLGWLGPPARPCVDGPLTVLVQVLRVHEDMGDVGLDVELQPAPPDVRLPPILARVPPPVADLEEPAGRSRRPRPGSRRPGGNPPTPRSTCVSGHALRRLSKLRASQRKCPFGVHAQRGCRARSGVLHPLNPPLIPLERCQPWPLTSALLP